MPFFVYTAQQEVDSWHFPPLVYLIADDELFGLTYFDIEKNHIQYL